MQDAHGSLKELCANSEKDNQRLADKLKKLESAQKNLANSNNQLLQAREKITKEKTEMEKEMARLKSLEATDKSELDLQNRRFKSTAEDLKRQNRKLEGENIALKERAYGLKEQLSKLHNKNHNKGEIHGNTLKKFKTAYWPPVSRDFVQAVFKR
ncbi:hypothetical protein VN0858_06420 [Helicobacter pylori]